MKLIVAFIHVVKQFSRCHDWHCLEPYKISLHLRIAFPSDTLLYFSDQDCVFYRVCFLQFFHLKRMNFSSPSGVLPVPPILSALICLPWYSAVKTTSHVDPHIFYVFFSILLSLMSVLDGNVPLITEWGKNWNMAQQKSLLFLTFKVPVYKHCAVSNK